MIGGNKNIDVCIYQTEEEIKTGIERFFEEIDK
jgi:hypothetical protein